MKNKNSDPFLLWGTYPKPWAMIKDLALLLLLLNTLIGQFEKLPPKTITIIQETIATPAEAKQEAQEAPQATPEAEKEPEAHQGNFSAYNSEPGQTDDDPYTMANGKTVHPGAIANNCLPFGSKIELNGQTYTVEDRMNRRFGCDHFDIWMPEKHQALSFGRQTLTYTVK